MTTGLFKYIDPASYVDSPNNPSRENKPWHSVDDGGKSFILKDHQYPVHNIRGNEDQYGPNISGFGVYNFPSKEKSLTDDKTIRTDYYPEVEALVREKLPGVKKVVIFDHTIRRHDKSSPRQPVQQVHVDQTPNAAEVRVRRHLPEKEAESLLTGRYQIINVWRPIGHVASDFPLAVIDWRSTSPQDLIKVDLLYPKRTPIPPIPNPKDSGYNSKTTSDNDNDDNDDRGKEQLPDSSNALDTSKYEVKGETYAVAPSKNHKFFYMKDMTPDEAMFIKCFDSRSDRFSRDNEEGINGGIAGVADLTPHTAFVDPGTPADAPGRQSIEVRCLVFYE